MSLALFPVIAFVVFFLVSTKLFTYLLGADQVGPPLKQMGDKTLCPWHASSTE